MDLIIAGGDVVTMNSQRQVLLGGSVAVADGLIAAVGSTAELRAASSRRDGDRRHRLRGHARHDQRPPAPDGRPIGAQLHPRSAGARRVDLPVVRADPRRAHRPTTTSCRRTCAAIECAQNGVTTVIEAGTVAHPERVAKAMQTVGIRGTVGTWGWDIEEGPFIGTVAEVLDRQRAVVEAFPVRRAGRGLGHPRRPRSGQRRVACRCRRTGPRAAHGHDDAHVADLVGSRELPRAHRPTPVAAPERSRRARPEPVARPRGVARRRGDRSRCCRRERRSPTARGRTSASARA